MLYKLRIYVQRGFYMLKLDGKYFIHKPLRFDSQIWSCLVAEQVFWVSLWRLILASTLALTSCSSTIDLSTLSFQIARYTVASRKEEHEHSSQNQNHSQVLAME